MSSSSTSNTSVRSIGRVKWFNNKSGYGFITVTTEGVATDIFAHHSDIKVADEQYKYLIQGEYVEFCICKATEGSHEFKACEVSGINGGKLMCETRNEFKQQQPQRMGFSSGTSDKPRESTWKFSGAGTGTGTGANTDSSFTPVQRSAGSSSGRGSPRGSGRGARRGGRGFRNVRE